MSETLYTVRNLKLFNRLNKSIKQGITELQQKDQEAGENFLNFAVKDAKKLEQIAEDKYKPYFGNIIKGIGTYLSTKNVDILISTKPDSVHSQLWSVHKKICDDFKIPYLEDVDEMDAAINKLAEEGKIS